MMPLASLLHRSSGGVPREPGIHPYYFTLGMLSLYGERVVWSEGSDEDLSQFSTGFAATISSDTGIGDGYTPVHRVASHIFNKLHFSSIYTIYIKN
jgi:hypothetical protein